MVYVYVCSSRAGGEPYTSRVCPGRAGRWSALGSFSAVAPPQQRPRRGTYIISLYLTLLSRSISLSGCVCVRTRVRAAPLNYRKPTELSLSILCVSGYARPFNFTPEEARGTSARAKPGETALLEEGRELSNFRRGALSPARARAVVEL